MNRRSLITFAALCVAITLTLFSRGQDKKVQAVLSTNELGFPLELFGETKVPGFFPTWEGKILISVENYSKDNLDRIFIWFSKRHPKEDGKIVVSLYTNKKDLEKKIPFSGIPPGPNTEKGAPAPFNAVFFRLDEEDNEFYVYDLNPMKKDQQRRVILKGRDPFAQ